jgi:hypothetical protein
LSQNNLIQTTQVSKKEVFFFKKKKKLIYIYIKDASIPRYHPSADKRFNRLEQKDALQAMHNALPSPTSTPNTPLPSNERKYDPKSIHSLLISPSNEDRIPQHHGLISDTSRMFNPVIQWNAM